MITRAGVVRIRRDVGLGVKPEAEQLDGHRFVFYFGWHIEECDTRYPGEAAWIVVDHPPGAPTWVASGDIEFMEASAGIEPA